MKNVTNITFGVTVFVFKCQYLGLSDRLVNFHWARVRFGPVPLASCGNGSGVNSPTAVSFTVLSQTPRRPSYFRNSIIALAMLIYFDTGLLLKAKRPIRDLTTERESRSNMGPSDFLD